MNLAAQIISIVAAATALGGGLYKLGSGLTAMSGAIKSLTAAGADHETRLRALEHAGGVIPPGAGPAG